jgi:hypothetical protein
VLPERRPCFARTEPWLPAGKYGKYAAAVMSELPERSGVAAKWRSTAGNGDRWGITPVT